MFFKKEGGFTLLELLIVIVIIAILLLIAIPQFKNYIVRSQISEGFSVVQPIKLAVGEYVQDTGQWPADMDALSLDSVSGKYVKAVTVSNGTISVEYGKSGGSAEIKDKKLSFVAGFSEGKSNGAILFYCNGKDVPDHVNLGESMLLVWHEANSIEIFQKNKHLLVECKADSIV